MSALDKIYGLKGRGKADNSVIKQYNKMLLEKNDLKEIYKKSKEAYLDSKEQLEMAREEFDAAPFLKKFRKARKLRRAKRMYKLKRKQYRIDKENYKFKIAQIRTLRKEFRNQAKSANEYVKFFDRVEKARSMGINLPRYIMEEYKKQKETYSQEVYSVDESGRWSYISKPNTDCSKDVQSLINERKRQKAAEKMNKVKEKIASALPLKSKNDEGR